jgi:hypothetical protein
MVRGETVSVDVGTVITDYDFAEEIRPEITITENGLNATVQIGGHDGTPCQVVFDLKSTSKEDLASQFAGWSEIFAKAAEVAEK